MHGRLHRHNPNATSSADLDSCFSDLQLWGHGVLKALTALSGKLRRKGSTSRMNEDAGNNLCNILTIKAPKVVICQAAGPWVLVNISQYKHVCQVRGN